MVKTVDWVVETSFNQFRLITVINILSISFERTKCNIILPVITFGDYLYSLM